MQAWAPDVLKLKCCHLDPSPVLWSLPVHSSARAKTKDRAADARTPPLPAALTLQHVSSSLRVIITGTWSYYTSETLCIGENCMRSLGFNFHVAATFFAGFNSNRPYSFYISLQPYTICFYYHCRGYLFKQKSLKHIELGIALSPSSVNAVYSNPRPSKKRDSHTLDGSVINIFSYQGCEGCVTPSKNTLTGLLISIPLS